MTYRAQDGFRAKQQWIETHEVTAVDPSGITVRITTEEWSAPGQVRVGLYDHETRYFDVPLQRFDLTLASGEKWNQWVRNSDETMKARGTINRYVRVGGWEKVSTPAVTFDAIKLFVVMHLDDGEFWPRAARVLVVAVPFAVGAVVSLLIVLSLAGALFRLEVPAQYKATYAPSSRSPSIERPSNSGTRLRSFPAAVPPLAAAHVNVRPASVER